MMGNSRESVVLDAGWPRAGWRVGHGRQRSNIPSQQQQPQPQHTVPDKINMTVSA